MPPVKYFGPHGTETNELYVDKDTLALTEAQPPTTVTGQGCPMLETVTAHGMYVSATALMDEYAEEVFRLWFTGAAGPEEVFDDERWAKYMRASEELNAQILEKLTEHAQSLKVALNRGTDRVDGDLALQFHANVGGQAGGYRTGYEVLHGSNRTVGDFQVKGRFAAHRTTTPVPGFTVVYSDLRFVFNDIVDINKKYKMDVSLGQTAKNMAKCIKTGPPKDYILRIKWKALVPIQIMVGPKGEVFSAGPMEPLKPLRR